MFACHKKNLIQSILLLGLVALVSSCAIPHSPTVQAPPIDLKELDPFYLSFLKEQCRGYSLKQGTAEFDQCLLKLADQNRDVTMYKYSDQYRKRVAKALSNVETQESQSTHAQSQNGTDQAHPSTLTQGSVATVASNHRKSLMQAVKDCDQLTADPQVKQEVIGPLLVANEQSDNKLDLLANHNKITPNQKPLVKAFAKAHYLCFQQLEKQITGVAEADAVSNYMNTTDQILAEFYSGDTTVAQTNSAFLKAKAMRDNALERAPGH
ncbi:MAG: hypothetical protein KGN31_01750 [Betaproteobacteria bacterium]|nr:hypothetical protein [Betaproteobacteria bacterium]MDE2422917.1 hypothetical protein [Betaproteobacteria bacterium]